MVKILASTGIQNKRNMQFAFSWYTDTNSKQLYIKQPWLLHFIAHTCWFPCFHMWHKNTKYTDYDIQEICQNRKITRHQLSHCSLATPHDDIWQCANIEIMVCCLTGQMSIPDMSLQIISWGLQTHWNGDLAKTHIIKFILYNNKLYNHIISNPLVCLFIFMTE